MTDISEVKITFENGLKALQAALETCDKGEYILAWDTGLGIAYTEDTNSPYVCGVMFAAKMADVNSPEEMFAYVPNIINGNGEPAKLVLRYDALKNAINEHEKILQSFNFLAS